MRPRFHLAIDVPIGRVRIDGDLDLSSDQHVTSVFATLEDLGVLRVEADLAGVTFVDAYALGLLRRIQRELALNGGGLRVVAGSDRYVRTCRLARYDTLLPTASAAAATGTASDRCSPGSRMGTDRRANTMVQPATLPDPGPAR